MKFQLKVYESPNFVIFSVYFLKFLLFSTFFSYRGVFMEFYRRNDITLGGFLERYCFRYGSDELHFFFFLINECSNLSRRSRYAGKFLSSLTSLSSPFLNPSFYCHNAFSSLEFWNSTLVRRYVRKRKKLRRAPKLKQSYFRSSWVCFILVSFLLCFTSETR